MKNFNPVQVGVAFLLVLGFIALTNSSPEQPAITYSPNPAINSQPAPEEQAPVEETQPQQEETPAEPEEPTEEEIWAALGAALSSLNEGIDRHEWETTEVYSTGGYLYELKDKLSECKTKCDIKSGRNAKVNKHGFVETVTDESSADFVASS